MPNSLSTQFIDDIVDYPHAMTRLRAIREQSFKAQYPDEQGALDYWEHVVAWLDDELSKPPAERMISGSLLREMRKYANESLEVVRKRYVERMANRVISGDHYE